MVLVVLLSLGTNARTAHVRLAQCGIEGTLDIIPGMVNATKIRI